MLGPVEIVSSVGSTNAELAVRARAGAPAGAVLVADHQTAGRGRLDRRWEAAPGSSLLVSVLLRPDVPAERAHLASVAAGLAAVAACRAVGATVGLKWPNDVVVDGADGTRKLAGILAERVVGGAEVPAVVVGMGLNLLDGPHVPDTGTTLEALVGRPVARDEVLAAWLAAYEPLVVDLDAVVGPYRAACTTIGRRVRVERAAGTFEAQALDVTDDGHLVLDADGGRVVVAEGDVTHVRAVANELSGE